LFSQFILVLGQAYLYKLGEMKAAYWIGYSSCMGRFIA